jgi:hypothetical protein
MRLKGLLGIEVVRFTYPYHIVTFAKLNILASYLKYYVSHNYPKIR